MAIVRGVGQQIGELLVQLDAVGLAAVAALAEALEFTIHGIEAISSLFVELGYERLVAFGLPPHCDDQYHGHGAGGDDDFECFGNERGVHGQSVCAVAKRASICSGVWPMAVARAMTKGWSRCTVVLCAVFHQISPCGVASAAALTCS